MGKKTKKYKPKIKKSPPRVVVPDADDMDDETLLKHIELRHRDEAKVETYISRRSVSAWIGMYRAFHGTIHRLATPGQYDHVHEGDV